MVLSLKYNQQPANQNEGLGESVRKIASQVEFTRRTPRRLNQLSLIISQIKEVDSLSILRPTACAP